jgi:FkbH-like protein
MALKGYAYEQKMNIEIYDADYNQIESQILEEKSELYSFQPDTVLIYMCTEKLCDRFAEVKLEERKQFADRVFEEIMTRWERLCMNKNCNILQFLFVEKMDRVFGNFAYKLEESFDFQLKKLNYLLITKGCQQLKNVYLIDLGDICFNVGNFAFCDDKMYDSAKMTITFGALPYVAKQVVDVIKSIMGKVVKCVILDLDNTLWGGIIGDDGLEKIQLGEFGQGSAFSRFQKWLKELKKRGILLVVCSKNEESIAKEPFLKHPDMILRIEDIAMFVSNWENKADNIIMIQSNLNIGMDSMVFIDDNAFERNLVRTTIPDIIVPELPEDPALYVSYLQQLNLFETISYSYDEIERTNQYQIEMKRTNVSKQYQSYTDYLEDLQMVATMKEFEPFQYPRIAQLTQRSNQFNLRTIRYTEAQIDEIANNKGKIPIYFTLKDRFGDYGLISVVILEQKDSKTLFINTWVMSCRVLKRGMEEFVMNEIIDLAKEFEYEKIIGEYIPTPKNGMVKDIYKKMNFIEISQNYYEVSVKQYIMQMTKIQKKQEGI